MVVFMADVCDYIYVSGLRFKSGTPFIEIQSSFLDAVSKEPSKEPSKLVRLAVVRDGKGASRLDRWASKPARFGVVGEINLRDLSKVLDSSGMSDVDAMVSLSLDDSSDGGLISLVLDPTAAMGRRGRLLDSDMIDDALLSLPDTQCQALVKEQLRSMPYGIENTKAASIRLQVLLRHATPETIAEAVKESTDFIKHIDRETVALMPPAILTSIKSVALSLAHASPSHYNSYHSLEASRYELSIMAAADLGQNSHYLITKVPKDTIPFIDDNFIVAAAMRASVHENPLSSHTFKYVAYAPLVKSKDALELLLTTDPDITTRGFNSGIINQTDSPYVELTKLLESRLSEDTSRLEAMAARFPGSILETAISEVLKNKRSAPTPQPAQRIDSATQNFLNDRGYF
jgi:hypothetical protein